MNRPGIVTSLRGCWPALLLMALAWLAFLLLGLGLWAGWSTIT